MFPTIVALRNERVVGVVRTPRLAATLECAADLAVGLDPQALVVAAQAGIEGETVLAYSVMTSKRSGKFAVQPVRFNDDGSLAAVAEPVDGGKPKDPTILEALAAALGQQPLGVDQISRSSRSGTFGEDLFLPPERGRVVVDAGTISTLARKVAGIGGQALYVARSPEAGKLAREAGLPKPCLLDSAS